MKKMLSWLSIALFVGVLCSSHSTEGIAMIPSSRGLSLQNVGTEQVYFAYDGRPLLSFGTMTDNIFWVEQDAFDYKAWADWQAAHGMNHCRAYLPAGWVLSEDFTKRNGGDVSKLLFPYMETEPGSRKFDLTKFNQAFWDRLRAQCQYLESKGVIIDLLMLNGWQMWTYNDEVKARNWDAHFFNPRNNVNDFTRHLAGGGGCNEPNRLQFYHSIADGQTELFEAQKAYYEKIIETTHDLGNIYYELVHEIAQNYDDWDKTRQWLEAIALAVRAKWNELEPNRPIILGTDAGHLEGFPFSQSGGFPEEGSEIDWVYTRPYFDVLIWGNHHHTANAREWRRKYKKPYIGQESRDDSTEAWKHSDPEMRVHIRKYMWKFMMVKCQQMDLYLGTQDIPDPKGINKFEDDALKLRAFWNRLVDYSSLDFVGHVSAGPAGHHLVLSSPKEAIIYVSSPTSVQGRRYTGNSVKISHLALPVGACQATFFDPEQGVVGEQEIRVREGGSTSFRMPDYVDDMAVHVTPVKQ
jgi:hypothetical protein